MSFTRFRVDEEMQLSYLEQQAECLWGKRSLGNESQSSVDDNDNDEKHTK
jgi:hypothetical protein